MFFEKKHPPKRDMDIIKQALSDEEMPVEKPPLSERYKRQNDARVHETEFHEITDVEDVFEPRYKQRLPEAAPLFVKVDKYGEIMSSVRDMKNFVSGMKQLFSILNDLEGVRSESLNILRASIQKIEKDLFDIDASLLRPPEAEFEMRQETAEVSQIEDSLKDLQSQLASLRRDLQQFK